MSKIYKIYPHLKQLEVYIETGFGGDPHLSHQGCALQEKKCPLSNTLDRALFKCKYMCPLPPFNVHMSVHLCVGQGNPVVRHYLIIIQIISSNAPDFGMLNCLVGLNTFPCV